jgi:hypothetical protein
VTPFDEGAQLLLYTDGVSETLAGSEGCGKRRIQATIEEHTASDDQ